VPSSQSREVEVWHLVAWAGRIFTEVKVLQHNPKREMLKAVTLSNVLGVFDWLGLVHVQFTSSALELAWELIPSNHLLWPGYPELIAEDPTSNCT
jgi:hypothetical protein